MVGRWRCVLAASILACAVTIPRAEPRGEFPLPVFDHESIAASFVVSAPKGHDPKTPLPLIIDLHGAIAPTRKGASVTRDALWSRFVEETPCIVAGPNGRTRAWGRVEGEIDDAAYVLRVLAEVRKRYAVDEQRVYLAGFSSGSDFLCQGELQPEGPFAGTLIVCPGPPHVVGIRGGKLARAKDHPFLFATGEEDHIRKSGAWEAFLALEAAGARTMYREVPGRGHEFLGVEETGRLFTYLEGMAHRDRAATDLAIAVDALARDDLLLASTHLLRVKSQQARRLLAEIEARGKALVDRANAVDAVREPGRAYEAWWRIRTQLHRFPDLAERARAEMTALEEQIPRRDLYRARSDYFRRRKGRAPAEKERPGAGAPADDSLWRFDRYLTYEQAVRAIDDLERRFPDRVRVKTIGRSVKGRPLRVLELTDRRAGEPEDKPALWLQAAIHGNETSTVMVALYSAWQLAANPEASRTVDRLMRDVTVYVLPVMNPDGFQRHLSGAFSPHDNRLNDRPYDVDLDGRVDEDPCEDLDGDGEIGLMYVQDPKGPFVLRDGRLLRGKNGTNWRLVGREGLDRDRDGRYSEDRAGGVDLNRNFPVGFRSRDRIGGPSGRTALSEPESRAVARFVESRPNIALFLDYHNHANCLYYWLGPEATGDEPTFEAFAKRVGDRLGYPPRPLRHSGVGLAIAWAYRARGIPAFIVELEPYRGRRDVYDEAVWGGEAFMRAKPFRHPKLGRILLGNDYRKIAHRNLHPSDIFWQVDRNWAWLREELRALPRLELHLPRITATKNGFRVTGTIRNVGAFPTDTRMGKKRTDYPISLTARGALISGDTELPGLAAGGSHTFTVDLVDREPVVALTIHHPRAGRIELPIRRTRRDTIPIRREYPVPPGYATPDRAVRATNEHYRDGRTDRERGPAFAARSGNGTLRIAVLLGEWEDAGHVVDAEAFEKAFFLGGNRNGTSPTGQPTYGSVRDFYAEMSHGRLEVTGKVFDWATLPGTRAEARDASFGSPKLTDDLIAAVLARHGADALEGYDALALVWAGNAISRTSMLWPMRLNLRDRPGVVAFKTSELFHGEMMPIGVACHELAHTFGVNDKYGLGAAPGPVGPWCLIGKGTHGAPPSGRHRPFHLCAWCKAVIGWVDPAVIDPARPQRLALRPILYGPGEAYRILLRPDGSEYLLLENRRREGFDTDLPSAGLVVFHVGPNDKPGAPQAMISLLSAHGLPPLGRSDPAEPEKVAWPQIGRTELVVGGVRLSRIRLVDDVVLFEVGPAAK